MNEQMRCPRCGTVNASSARFCQQCGFSLLGPAGSKGVPTATDQQPTAGPGSPQQTGPGQRPQNWNQGLLGGLAGFLLGSMLGGGRGMFGGWGGGRDWDGGGDFGGGDFGGGDFGGGDGGGDG